VTTPLQLGFGSMRASVTLESLLPSLGIDNGRISVGDYSFDLRAENPVSTILRWRPPALAPPPVSYDVIRGFVHALFKDASTIHLGPVVCLENDSRDTTTAAGAEPSAPDTGIPAPGRSFFYLVRFHDGLSNQSYGFGGQCSVERKVDSRDCP
jgi:hypothetical protein